MPPVTRLLRWLAAGLTLIMVLAAGAFVGIREFVRREMAPPGTASAKVVVEVSPGSSQRQVNSALVDAGLIRFKRLPLLAARLGMYTPPTSTYKAGEYLMDKNMSVAKILDKLFLGQVRQYCVTIPEGADLFQLEEIFRRESALSATAGLGELLWSARLADDLNVAFPSAEGILFPETYCFTKGSSAKSIVMMMAGKFEETLRSMPGAGGTFTKEQRLIVASLVEKEARVNSERPVIASVYFNRIRKGMALQADPTVIYAMKMRGSWNGNIRREDLERPHPFNTYAHAGLPPGPICSPGWESMRAAWQPADTGLLYFVARRDGSHAFSETYEEHARNVAKYQR